MRILFKDEFKQDYLNIKGIIADPGNLDENLKIIARAMKAGEKLPGRFASNRMVAAGAGWNECYVFGDKRLTVVLLYKMDGDSVVFARLGRPEDLMKKLNS